MSVELTTLANGFRIVSEHMPGLQSASLGVWVSAGARHERADQNGIAHFLEHMAFKGTEKRSALDIAEAIENVGGYINAYTSRENTAYYVRVLKEDVPLAFDVISDIVLNSTFDPRELEIERGVILQEIGQTLDTPDDIIFDWLQEVAYPDQSFGRSILGPAERVKHFARADLQDFVTHHYTPGQMILAAAGAVDHDQLVRMAEQAFGELPVTKPSAADPATYRGGERRVVKGLEQAHFALSLKTGGYKDDDLYTGQIYAVALGGGMSSRLFQEAREKRGLCYTIYAQAAVYSDTGTLTIYSGTSEKDIADLAALCMDELNRSAADMTTAEINRARAQMKAGLMMSLESPAARCERLARMIGIWGYVPDLEEIIGKINAVTAPSVMQYAERLCDTTAPSIALYGPVKSAPSVDHLSERLVA